MANFLRKIFSRGQEIYSLEDLKGGAGVSKYNLAKKLIPGGTQLLSKRPEMFAPDVWPSYYSKAKGSIIWDLDGRKFCDMSIMSVGACILGYADDEVDRFVIEALRKGVSSSLNCPEEVELAEILLNLHPWFGMVRYSKSGGEAMAIAVRIARTFTSRDHILFSGYHGWHDWYLSANLHNEKSLDDQLMKGLSPNGVPAGLIDTSLPFLPNSISSLREMIKGKEKSIAAIVIEPARGIDSSPDYLKELRDLSSEIGAVLIFDEITSGFRLCAGGIHRRYETKPDLAVFAKSMANGYPMAAVLGIEKVMEACQDTFISSTNWTERSGLSASIATIKKYLRLNVDKKIIQSGNKVKDIWRELSIKYDVPLEISGLPTLAAFRFKSSSSNLLNTIFTVEMLKRGFLAFRQFKASLAHSNKNISHYRFACDEVFKLFKENNPNDLLKTPIHHEGFKRLTKE